VKVIVSSRVAKEYGARIRRAVPRVRLAVPEVRDGAVAWTADPAGADACCFSEDLWQEEEQRRLVLPHLFRIQGLRWLHTFSAGVDAPVFQVLLDRGVILTNSSGATAKPIAQYVIAMMLHRAKRIAELGEQQRRREWRELPADELTGRTAGIVGTGAIGGEVARLAKAFGMHVIGARRSERRARWVDEQVTPKQLPRLLSRSDYVVLACPLTKETEGMIGERELRAMKPTATLINIARGRVVQEDALVRALREGWIAGACLDVFATEPLPEDSELWSMPNVVVTPHNSGFSPLNMDRAMALFLDNLERFAADRPLRNRVRSTG